MICIAKVVTGVGWWGINGSDRVMGSWVMFSVEISQVEEAVVPEEMEVILRFAVLEPKYHMVMALEHLILTFQLAMPVAVMWSIWMGIGPWG